MSLTETTPILQNMSVRPWRTIRDKTLHRISMKFGTGLFTRRCHVNRQVQGQPYFKSLNYFLPVNSTFMYRFEWKWIQKVSQVLSLRKCESSEILNSENHSFHNSSNEILTYILHSKESFYKIWCLQMFAAVYCFFLWFSGKSSRQILTLLREI
jgi:hypothetical protein